MTAKIETQPQSLARLIVLVMAWADAPTATPAPTAQPNTTPPGASQPGQGGRNGKK